MVSDPLLSLGLFAVVATITPGGATTLATASGARFGFRRSVPLMAGIALGLAMLAAAAAIGLAGLLLAAPALQLAMKVAGSAYLIWLGFRTLQSARRDGWTLVNGGSAPPAIGARRAFREGVLVEALNPKTAAFFLAFAPRRPLPAALLVASVAGLGW